MTSACAWATGHAAAFHSMTVRATFQNHSDTKPILESSGSLPMPWLLTHRMHTEAEQASALLGTPQSMLTEADQASALLESPTSPQIRA